MRAVKGAALATLLKRGIRNRNGLVRRARVAIVECLEGSLCAL